MSNHANNKTINLHHTQVNNAKLRKIRQQYRREHEAVLKKHRMRAFGIAWEVFKAVYIACVIFVLINGLIYALSGLYGS